MPHSFAQLEAVFLPFGADGIVAVATDGTIWGCINTWKTQLSWTQLPSLPGGRIVQSIVLTVGWDSVGAYALATDGTIWGIRNITYEGASWTQGSALP